MKRLKKVIKKPARIILDIGLLAYGLIYYYFNNKKPLNERTPHQSYQAMIRLFCATRGYSNDILAKLIACFDKKMALQNYDGILGNFSEKDLKNISSQLQLEGYYIFEKKLSSSLINTLYEFASQAEFLPRRPDGQNECIPIQRTKYNKKNLQSSVYDMPLETILFHPNIQSILRDHSILGIAQEYLDVVPKMDIISFWWSTPFSNKPQSNSAQEFHFDMDRIKWLKFFIFLTDVTLETGPHVFISQSHQSSKIPDPLLKAGYARHSDEEILKYYSEEKIKTFTVKAGTIIAEDTRGLHKGTPLIKGERLVLELQYSNCLFGATTPAIQSLDIKDNQLNNFIKNYPKIFKLYPV